MNLWDIEAIVKTEVKNYCRTKGYTKQEGVNNFIPHNCVHAFQMAKMLIKQDFDSYLVIAPEGFIYSYFFEQLGARVLSLYTDYPPTRISATDDLSQIQGKRVLLIEDDVIGGGTLRLVMGHLSPLSPKEVSLYLGHNRGFLRLQNVPSTIHKIYLAEDELASHDWMQHEREFIEFFSKEVR